MSFVESALDGIQSGRFSRRVSGRWALLATLLAVATFTRPVFAQLGNGWVSTSYTKKIHLDDEAGLQTFNWTTSKSVCNPVCADYNYDAATETETFRLLDGRTNRSEIRLQNEYSTGIRQFEGYVTFYSPLNDESLFQIFGSTSGATLCMMRGYSASGGKIRVVGGIGDIQLNTYGVERRINVIHNQNKYVQFYVDGVLKGEFDEDEQVENYWKYGNYGTVASDTVPAVVKWRAVRTFADGLPPGALASPAGAYEAENGLFSGALVSATQSGFSGTGYVDFQNSTGDYIDWAINAPVAGIYDLNFRYALQSGNRPLSIQVNNQMLSTTLNFSSTGNWQAWDYAAVRSLYLPAGSSSIRLSAVGSGGPNLDHLLVTAGFGADLNGDGLVDAADWARFKSGSGSNLAGMTSAQAYAIGDLNGDFLHNLTDFALFRQYYENANGDGSFSGLLRVPEPSGCLLAFLVLFSLSKRTRAKHRLTPN